MCDFKSEYKRAIDKIEPDSRLLEKLKADMKAAAKVPPKPNFFVRYRWTFGTAAACLVMVLAVGVFLTLGRPDHSGGSAMYDGAANDAAANTHAANTYIEGNVKPEGEPESAEMDGDSSNMAPSAAANGAAYDAAKDSEKAGGNVAVTTSTTVLNKSDELTGDSTYAAGDAQESFGTVADDSSDIYSILGIMTERIEALRALSYADIKELTSGEEGTLTLADFLRFDHIDKFSGRYILIMRYENGGVSRPLAATFHSTEPDEPLMSLVLFYGYNNPNSYAELSWHWDDIDRYLSAEYWYTFGNDGIGFDNKQLDRHVPITVEQLKELAAKAERGALAYTDFKGLDHLAAGYGSIYTLVSSCFDESTGQGYALISYFLSGADDAAPAYVILRRRDSEEELDLLNEYYLLDRFLA